jgi:hypothetical protein
LLLDADLSVACFEGAHADYTSFAVGSILLFLVGIPFTTFVLLYKNRKRLHLPSVEAEYGDLYKPYEKHWYFWECILMVQKCLLTGAMCAIMPGSPIQLLIALLIVLGYLLVVLKASPYKGILEDTLAFVTSLCLSLSLILGFAIITDTSDAKVFNMTTMGMVLIAINVLPFFFLMYALLKIVRKGSDVGILAEEKTADNQTFASGSKGSTKVTPAKFKKVKTEEQQLAQQKVLNENLNFLGGLDVRINADVPTGVGGGKGGLRKQETHHADL